MGAPGEGASSLRIVVCDTGPILHLREAGVLDVLAFAGEVIVPAAVDEELARLVDDWASVRPSWLVRRVLHAAEAPSGPVHSGLTGLGPGETEAILLARQVHADWLLTDDAEARLVASLAGLDVHGSLGVVLWAAASGHLDRAHTDAALKGLVGSSLWMSTTIITEARTALRKIYDQP